MIRNHTLPLGFDSTGLKSGYRLAHLWYKNSPLKGSLSNKIYVCLITLQITHNSSERLILLVLELGPVIRIEAYL